jgi:uncharacterized protein (TIGR03437 family)
MVLKSTSCLLVISIGAWAQSASINGLNPSTKPAGSAATPLAIAGQSLGSTASVAWTTPDGRVISISPDAIAAAQVSATIPSALLSTAGTAQVSVADGNGTLSNQLPFTITVPPTAITSLNPSRARAGSFATPLAINGQTLGATASVSWTTPDGRTVSLSPGLVAAAQVSATIPSALLSTAGIALVAVVDGSGVLSNQLPFTVGAPLMSVSTAPLPNGTVGVAYGPLNLIAANGTAPYSWKITRGALPAGISLDPTGFLSGIPAAPGGAAFGLQATDASGAIAAGSFTMSVNASSLQLTAITLPAAIAGSEYPAQILSATGGQPPYTFSVTGTMPAGLTFANGQISGAPTTAGTANLTLGVSDSANPPASVSSAAVLTVKPAQTDLVLGGANASFSIAAGSTGAPPPFSIPVSSSVGTKVINFSTTVTPAAPWLTVAAGVSLASSPTPAAITIGLSNAALSLAAAAAPYQTSVVVTCLAPAACAGNTQTISVSLSVVTLAPQLSVGNTLLPFTGSSASPQASTEALYVQNAGGGSLAITSITAADKWLTIGTVPPTLGGGPATPISVTADPTGLKPGFYRSSITVVTSAGRISVPATFEVSPNPLVILGPAGILFNAVAGNPPGNPTGLFAVGTATGSAIAFTATVQPGAAWLSISKTTAGAVSFAIDPVASSALAPNAYYGTIRVTAPGALNPTADFQVVLNVAPATSPALPDPQPAGLLFIASSGTPAAQTVQLFASSKTPVPYQASAATTTDGHAWLNVGAATGTTSSGAPAQSSISVSLAGLTAGVYRGGVTYSYAGVSVRTVNVTLIVEPQAALVTGSVEVSRATLACTPAQLVPTQTGLLSNFATPASWPQPLIIQLTDNCGNSISNGQITASFNTGDPVMILTPTDNSSGIYTATWTPRGISSQVSIAIQAGAPGLPPSLLQIGGEVKPGIAPSITPQAVLNIFDPEIGAALAPGTVVQIYGNGLAAQAVSPGVVPLLTSVAGTVAYIGGIAAPLYYVGPNQINAQIPFELTSGSYQVIVAKNGVPTTPEPIVLTATAPGVLAFISGETIAQHQAGGYVSDDSPAYPGEYLVFYVAGMGAPNTPAVTTGAGAPGDPLALTASQPVLTLDGNPVPVVTFAGLVAGSVGLYQVNFQVPTNARNGNLSLVLSQTGNDATTTILPVYQ